MRQADAHSHPGLVAVVPTADVLHQVDRGEALSHLEAEQRQRHDRLLRAEDRGDFLGARLLLRRMLSQYVDPSADLWSWNVQQTCPTCAGPHGRPYLNDQPGLGISWAHAGGLVAAAIAPGPIGVDIERVGEKPPPLPGRDDAPALDTWLRWTRTEALVKYGAGDLDTVLGWDLSGPSNPDGMTAKLNQHNGEEPVLLTDFLATDHEWVVGVAASTAVTLTTLATPP